MLVVLICYTKKQFSFETRFETSPVSFITAPRPVERESGGVSYPTLYNYIDVV